MDREQVFELLLAIARGGSLEALRAAGAVRPWGVALGPDAVPRTVHPADDTEGAPYEELLDFVVLDLREMVEADESILGVAIVTILESGADRAIGVQVEVPSAAAGFLLALEQGGPDWRLGEPEPVEGLFSDGVFPLQEP